MVRIDINTSPHYPANRKLIRLAVEETLKKIGVKSFVQLSVSVAGDRKVRELNRKFRGKDKTTNVLSFPLVARDEAAKDNILVDQRLAQLTVHGVLHLMGFDHEEPVQMSQMEKLEDDIYDKIGV